MIKKILIVDDSPIARKMLRKAIPSDKNYEIVEAVNGRDGIDKFVTLKPDITFMDLTMPIVDGFEATAEIRKIDKNAIIIVTTADIQRQSITRAMELGAFTLIKKPPSRKESIQDALDKAEMKLKQLSGVKS